MSAEATWTLADGEELHAKAPDTFELPERWERCNLRLNSLVKLMFLYAEPVEGLRGERMWVEVTVGVGKGSERTMYFGKVRNHAAHPKLLPSYDEQVSFEPKHVLAVAPVPPGDLVLQ